MWCDHPMIFYVSFKLLARLSKINKVHCSRFVCPVSCINRINYVPEKILQRKWEGEFSFICPLSANFLAFWPKNAEECVRKPAIAASYQIYSAAHFRMPNIAAGYLLWVSKSSQTSWTSTRLHGFSNDFEHWLAASYPLRLKLDGMKVTILPSTFSSRDQTIISYLLFV